MEGAGADGRVSTIELFFELVFAFPMTPLIATVLTTVRERTAGGEPGLRSAR